MQVADAQLIALKDHALEALGIDAETRDKLTLAETPDNQPGDRGFPVFVLARVLRQGPPQIAGRIADEIRRAIEAGEVDASMVAQVHAAGPYVNFTLATGELATAAIRDVLTAGARYGAGSAPSPETWMVEFSAPNTNKPQHLGHVRNNLLGQSTVELLKFAGHHVIPVNLINDRGIHICKSMLMYKLHGDGATPESTGVKGDHLVGRYYVMFDREFRKEYAAWKETPDATAHLEQWLKSPESAKKRKAIKDQSREKLASAFFDDYTDTYFNQNSALGAQTKQMLLDWEADDANVRALWAMMNSWVFAGFDKTYASLGISFDQVYYESNTYTLGKDLVEKGLSDGLFERVEGGAIACDLDTRGFPNEKKILLRSDGTSVYMTQDLGTALARFDEHNMDRMVYVVGNEQDHHFRVLFTVLGLLRPGIANTTDQARLIHKSYGMIALPEGRMKTRTGTVVDADDLIEGMIELSRATLIQKGALDALLQQGVEKGEANAQVERDLPVEAIVRRAHADGWPALLQEHLDLSPEDFHERARVIGLAGLKYFILKYNPKTNFTYDPASSIRPTGDSGVYALYTYARIQSIRREVCAGTWPEVTDEALSALSTDREMGVVSKIAEWPSAIATASKNRDPSRVTQYALELCSAFNAMYNDGDHRISGMDEGARRVGLLTLCHATGVALKTALGLLGIETLDAM